MLAEIVHQQPILIHKYMELYVMATNIILLLIKKNENYLFKTIAKNDNKKKHS